MSRITQTTREKICRNAIKAGFAAREEALVGRSHALAIEAYESVFDEAVRRQALAMPKDWLRYDSCLRFNANGWDVTLNAREAVPVPHSYYCTRIGTLDGEMAERVQAFSTEKEQLRNDIHRAERETSGFLEQFKSFKQMRETWPEGEPFYGSFDVEKLAGGVPAVRVAEINKLLNIAEAA